MILLEVRFGVDIIFIISHILLENLSIDCVIDFIIFGAIYLSC